MSATQNIINNMIPAKTISLYCVCADFGKYTKHFIDGNYVAIDWLPQDDLSSVSTREELYPLYRKEEKKS
jgi:hypothetical protein